jgi:hypothetical protein
MCSFPFLTYSQSKLWLSRSARLHEGEATGPHSHICSKGKMPTDSKGKKGLGEAIFDVVGFLSFLFGSLVLIAIVFGTIGGIFMSTKRLFQFKRIKGDEDNNRSDPEREVGKTTSNG